MSTPFLKFLFCAQLVGVGKAVLRAHARNIPYIVCFFKVKQDVENGVFFKKSIDNGV